MKKLMVLVLSVFMVFGLSAAVWSQDAHHQHNHDNMGQKKCKCMTMDHSHHGSHMGHSMAMQEDTKAHASCKYCGMNREMFSHSRMLIEYEDGTSAGTCSIHCASIELSLTMDKSVKAIKVGDYNTKKLIDAEKAFWVIGGSKSGVMTKRAKWAFEKKEDAEAFVNENGGRLATFDEAMKAAYEDMYEDTKMIREKRRMKAKEHRH